MTHHLLLSPKPKITFYISTSLQSSRFLKVRRKDIKQLPSLIHPISGAHICSSTAFLCTTYLSGRVARRRCIAMHINIYMSNPSPSPPPSFHIPLSHFLDWRSFGGGGRRYSLRCWVIIYWPFFLYSPHILSVQQLKKQSFNKFGRIPHCPESGKRPVCSRICFHNLLQIQKFLINIRRGNQIPVPWSTGILFENFIKMGHRYTDTHTNVYGKLVARKSPG